jgi:hypothetical protein
MTATEPTFGRKLPANDFPPADLANPPADDAEQTNDDKPDLNDEANVETKTDLPAAPASPADPIGPIPSRQPFVGAVVNFILQSPDKRRLVRNAAIVHSLGNELTGGVNLAIFEFAKNWPAFSVKYCGADLKSGCWCWPEDGQEFTESRQPAIR